jgi:hypothetical protein
MVTHLGFKEATMAARVIPLTSDPDQNFSCSLPIDSQNITLYFRLRYNTIAGYWVATIVNSQGVMLIDSMPLFNGQYPSADLLRQHKYLKIGSAYIIKTGQSSDDSPTEYNLGREFVLIWGDTSG